MIDVWPVKDKDEIMPADGPGYSLCDIGVCGELATIQLCMKSHHLLLLKHVSFPWWSVSTWFWIECKRNERERPKTVQDKTAVSSCFYPIWPW